MKIIALCSTKGGGGRTTLSTHLSVAATYRRLSTLLLDLDPQASSAQWADKREAPRPIVTSIHASRLDTALATARQSKVDLVVLDGAPNAPETMMEVCDCADLILVPSRPGILDIRAIRTTARIAKLSGKRAYAVLNQAPHRAPHMLADAGAALKATGLLVSPIVIHTRSAFSRCMVHGETAQEYEPGGKAAGEIEALFDWMMPLLATDTTDASNKADTTDKTDQVRATCSRHAVDQISACVQASAAAVRAKGLA